MKIGWLDASEGEAFAKGLALSILGDLACASNATEAKYRAKADKALGKAQRQVEQFKAGHALNIFKKSKTANAFLWALKDAGCPEAYAAELTDWLTLRL